MTFHQLINPFSTTSISICALISYRKKSSFFGKTLFLLVVLLIVNCDLWSVNCDTVTNYKLKTSNKELNAKSILHYYAGFVVRAVENGFNEANFLYDQFEPELYKKDIVIKGKHPSVFLAAINRQTPQAKELARYAYATLKATSYLKDQLAQFRDEWDHPLSKISLRDAQLKQLKGKDSQCPNRRQTDDCGQELKYRSADGTCNNLKNYQWGSSYQPFARYLPQEYDDGVSTIRKAISGKDLPSARLISRKVHKDVSRPSSTVTLMLMQWGQFIDHDMTGTSQTRAFNHSIPKCCNINEKEVHPDCLPISIPPGDLYFTNSTCMEFIRSSPAPRPECTLGAREQLNQLTSWIDGSGIYGSSAEELQSLRLFKKGKLTYSAMPSRKSLLPRLHHPHEGECILPSPRLYCFLAGDARANEQPGLTTFHTMFLRLHNLISDKLEALNPQWNEETLFQETRKILIGYIQYINYREFLPLVLGPKVMQVFGLRLLKSGFYKGYNDSIDGTVPNAFATAAFRFGHSLVQKDLHRCDEHHREMPYNIDISQEMMSPSNLHNFGEVDRILLGLAMQPAQRRDEFITSQLTNHLFQTQGHQGLDLAAINIQRGRDHGLPPYLKFREACGLLNPLVNDKPLENWDDFSEATGIPPARVKMLSETYESPWDVDLFPAGMIEFPVKGGLVGPTFACIIGQTFRNLRRADRFWFENEGQFTPAQMKSIRNITLARIVCETTDSIRTMQPIIFMAPHLQQNPHVDCTDTEGIPAMNFEPWAQSYTNTEEKVEDPIFYNANSNTINSDSGEVTTEEEFNPEKIDKLRSILY